MFEGTFDIAMELDPAKEMILSFETVERGICARVWFFVGREIISPSVICVVDIWLSANVNLRVVEVVRTTSCRSILITPNI